MNQSELKPCPFCGGIPVMNEDIRFGYQVMCSKCLSMTRRFEFKKDAVNLWNNRKNGKPLFMLEEYCRHDDQSLDKVIKERKMNEANVILLMTIFLMMLIVCVLLVVYMMIVVSAIDDDEDEGETMTGNDYQRLAMRTNDRMASLRLDSKMTENQWTDEDLGGILNACLGLSGEVGELNDLIKKWIFHEADIDLDHLKKELGDVCWYVAMMCESCGWNLDEILQMNVDKLKARYPEGFDPNRSAHRKKGDV